jgi:aldehyde dehydrogenase (NAD+)
VLYNNVPFGGKKQSGIGALAHRYLPPQEAILSCSPPGRELGSHALEEYISTKAVHWNYGENIEWPL